MEKDALPVVRIALAMISCSSVGEKVDSGSRILGLN